MIIVTASDDTFAPGLFGLIHSTWYHNPQAKFYVLDVGIGPVNRARLEAFCRTKGMDCTLISPDASQFDGFPVREYWSCAMYARLLIPELMKAHDKVIYFDVDILVAADISALWNIDLADNLVAGVADGFITPRELDAYGLAAESYVNTGVLVMNLALWRKERTCERIVEIIASGRKLLYPDQTAINVVTQGRRLLLPREWNFFAQEYPKLPLQVPKIIHYVGREKPWEFRSSRLLAVYDAHRVQAGAGIPAPVRTGRPLYRDLHKWILGLVGMRPKYWRHIGAMLYYRYKFTGPYIRSLQRARPPSA